MTVKGDTTRLDLRREQVVAWLRDRPQGATAKSLAALSGLSLRYVQSLCQTMEEGGILSGEIRSVSYTSESGKRRGASAMFYRLAEHEQAPKVKPIGVNRGRRPAAAARADAEPPPTEQEIEPDSWEGPPEPSERDQILEQAWAVLNNSMLVAAVTGRAEWPMAEVELVLLRAGLRALRGT